MHGARTRAERRALPDARGGVRVQGLPAAAGHRRLAFRRLPTRRPPRRRAWRNPTQDRPATRSPMNAAFALSPPPSPSLLHAWPMLAIALCTAGLAVRALVTTETRRPDLALHRAGVWIRGRRVLTGGFVLLLAGHLAALLLPRAILNWNRAPLRLYLLEGAAFGLGLLTFAAWLRATWRHLRRGEATFLVELGDALFLAMMFLAIASGLGMAALERWSSSWGIVTLRPYVLSILAGDPQRALVDALPFLTRLHLFATFAALAVFPLTRLAPLPILLVSRGAAVCARPVVRASRTGGVAVWNWCAAVL